MVREINLQKAVTDLKNGVNADEAYRDLYDATNRIALAVIRKYCGNKEEYEDILQKTYLEVFRGISQLRDDDKIQAWINQIATYTAIRHNKKVREQFAVPIPDDEEEGLELEDTDLQYRPETQIDRMAVREAVNDIIRTIPEDQQTVLWMVYGQEIKIKDAAQMLGVSENTVKSRLRIGRLKMESKKVEFRKYGIDLTLIPLTVLIASAFHTDAYAAPMAFAIPALGELFKNAGIAKTAETAGVSATTASGVSETAAAGTAGAVGTAATAAGASGTAVTGAAKGIAAVAGNKLLAVGAALLLAAGTAVAVIPKVTQKETIQTFDFGSYEPFTGEVIRNGYLVNSDALHTVTIGDKSVTIPCTVGEMKEAGFDFGDVHFKTEVTSVAGYNTKKITLEGREIRLYLANLNETNNEDEMVVCGFKRKLDERQMLDNPAQIEGFRLGIGVGGDIREEDAVALLGDRQEGAGYKWTTENGAVTVRLEYYDSAEHDGETFKYNGEAGMWAVTYSIPGMLDLGTAGWGVEGRNVHVSKEALENQEAAAEEEVFLEAAETTSPTEESSTPETASALPSISIGEDMPIKHFTINGKELRLPMPVKEFKAMGFELNEGTEYVDEGRYNIYTTPVEGGKLETLVTNPYSSLPEGTAHMDDCYVTGVMLEPAMCSGEGFRAMDGELSGHTPGDAIGPLLWKDEYEKYYDEASLTRTIYIEENGKNHVVEYSYPDHGELIPDFVYINFATYEN